MIERHYGDASVDTDQRDEMIGEFKSATGNLPGTLPDASDDSLSSKVKEPFVFLWGSEESGRPGSNRRRPAWEAFSALAGQGFFGAGSRNGITQYARCRLGFWQFHRSPSFGGGPAKSASAARWHATAEGLETRSVSGRTSVEREPP